MRHVYVEKELIEKFGREYFEGLNADDFVLAKEGLQDAGFFLEMNDNGDYYLSLNIQGDGTYEQI